MNLDRLDAVDHLGDFPGHGNIVMLKASGNISESGPDPDKHGQVESP